VACWLSLTPVGIRRAGDGVPAGGGGRAEAEAEMTDGNSATGATVQVEMLVDTDPGEMWDIVTDVSRIGEWSPECTGAAWLDDGNPEPGARFAGRNDFAGGFSATVTCVVTEARCPAVFEWVVLDPSEDPARPGSIWRYELTPGDTPGRTSVRQRFLHGPGLTGLKKAMDESPGQAADILAGRLDTLRKHMIVTLEGMAAS
jgi:uncharacterized protein YndB with AHSA1/START domain